MSLFSCSSKDLSVTVYFCAFCSKDLKNEVGAHTECAKASGKYSPEKIELICEVCGKPLPDGRFIHAECAKKTNKYYSGTVDKIMDDLWEMNRHGETY